MKNNNDNNNKVNRKIKQINKVKSFKKNISKYVPLSSVTIDIVGQHYKKRYMCIYIHTRSICKQQSFRSLRAHQHSSDQMKNEDLEGPECLNCY